MRSRWLITLVLILVAAVGLSGCSFLDRKTKAGLQVSTNDIPSTLFLDGQYLEKTPYIAKDIRPGTYTLRIQPDDANLVAHETTITLEKGLLSVVIWKPGTAPESSGGVMYEMTKLKNKRDTELSILTVPDNAIVKIDDQPTDFAPLLKTDLEAGQHEFEVSLPSYETQKHTINLVAGHKINVTVKLARNGGGETTNLPPAASASASATPKPSSSPNPSPTSATTSAQTSRQIPVVGPKVVIKKTNYFDQGQEVLRVRGDASPGAAEVGFAPVGHEYTYLNETKNGWFKIQFESQVGWVSGQYATLVQ